MTHRNKFIAFQVVVFLLFTAWSVWKFYGVRPVVSFLGYHFADAGNMALPLVSIAYGASMILISITLTILSEHEPRQKD